MLAGAAAAACGRLAFEPVPGAGDAALPDGAAPGVTGNLACGRCHTCVVTDGRLACSGCNDSGQLGKGDRARSLVPVAIRPDLDDWVQVVVGLGTCARRAGGDVYCWGPNDRGQVGIGSAAPDVLEPARVDLPAPARVLSLRFDTPCAHLVDDTLHCWGRNSEGELLRGNPGLNTPPAFEPAPSRIDPGAVLAEASVGQGHACAVTTAGEMYCWGANTEGELGDPGLAASQLRIPWLQPDGAVWRRVRATMSYTLAEHVDGRLFGWGEDLRVEGHPGALGLPGDRTNVPPTPLLVPPGAIDFAGVIFHSCALYASGELWCWGRNFEGALGRGDFGVYEDPLVIADDVVDMCLGWFHTCARKRDGTVACTGEGTSGEHGTGDAIRSPDWRTTLF